jgi:hypothetical protein
MAVSREEVRRNLVAFAQRWSLYSGSERAEAQTFLNELFECYGSDRLGVGAQFEAAQEGKFLDLIWPRHCIIEMKRPTEAARLSRHRPQAHAYWERSADTAKNIPAPRWLVLCAFQEFEIWEPGAYPGEPRLTFGLLDLPDQLEALMFLAGEEPLFSATQGAVTGEAVRLVTDLYTRLSDRRAAPLDVLRDFALQSVWCMFAEDLGQLPGRLFTRLLDDLGSDSRRSSADDLGQLFQWLNRKGERPQAGWYRDTLYVNGGLFARPAEVHLESEELMLLRLAAERDWRKVEPAIFGKLMEGALGSEARRGLGAHYTHEPDIQKIVGPTIVAPWTERLDNTSSLRDVQKLQNELLAFTVLDPACGSGNFLYIAYRELRRIEKRLSDLEQEQRRRQGAAPTPSLGAFFPLSNIFGIEIQPFAVELARVTLWMAHKLAVDELELSESTLPLVDLGGIRQGDALFVSWPKASVIVGNPPFGGDRFLRRRFGNEYLQRLQRTYRIGIKDHCVYWFRRAHDHLDDGGRAGLVGTNSITQNRARPESLDYILEHDGVITDAVTSQDWPGEAAVDVSIVNWTKGVKSPAQVRLNGEEITESIAASLRPHSIAVERTEPLAANNNLAFFGPIPGGEGFILGADEATQLLAGKPEEWKGVIRPYLIGKDLTDSPVQSPSRWIIDFAHRSLEDAGLFPEALAIVRERVKPQRDNVARPTYRRNWWRFSEPLRAMREAVAPLSRYIASPAQAKRIMPSFISVDVCPSNLVTVFALSEDYHLGVLASFAHDRWLRGGWSTLEDRLRYTPSTVFATFPWPSPGAPEREAVAEAARELLDTRTTLCSEHEVGLTKLYNRFEDGAFSALRTRHRELDRAVANAYGWPAATIDDTNDVLQRLIALNLRFVSNPDAYAGP